MLTRDEKLILLIEECGEVIQAATKILRFGWDRSQPNYGVNHEVLAVEIGDMLGVIDSLPLDDALMASSRENKIRKAERFKAPAAYTGPSPVPQPPYDESKPHMAYPKEAYLKMLAIPDEALDRKSVV